MTILNFLLRNILSINGVTGIFLGDDFLSVNKESDISWEDIKHIVISHINEYYNEGNDSIIKDSSNSYIDNSYTEIEKKIIHRVYIFSFFRCGNFFKLASI